MTKGETEVDGIIHEGALGELSVREGGSLCFQTHMLTSTHLCSLMTWKRF